MFCMFSEIVEDIELYTSRGSKGGGNAVTYPSVHHGAFSHCCFFIYIFQTDPMASPEMCSPIYRKDQMNHIAESKY